MPGLIDGAIEFVRGDIARGDVPLADDLLILRAGAGAVEACLGGEATWPGFVFQSSDEDVRGDMISAVSAGAIFPIELAEVVRVDEETGATDETISEAETTDGVGTRADILDEALMGARKVNLGFFVSRTGGCELGIFDPVVLECKVF